ncbi:MAG TPA: cytochrome c peroxidase [Geminicoccaceae bacterium]|nr:cytochrome c peroxidase [Geminicoccaceae bacterium]
MARLSRLLVVLLLLSLMRGGAAQTPEVPWHPLAHAYRSAVFLINLQPTDWSLVERTFTTPAGPNAPGPAARQYLVEFDQAAGTAHWPAIGQAIATEDRDALFRAATRAVSEAIRYHLAEAARQLDDPDAATRLLAEARALYRSFADFIQEADPSGFRDLGLAWLDLASSVGRPGIVGDAAKPADEVAFGAARGVIGSYLMANYEPDAPAPRATYAPIPERGLAADADGDVRPWLPPGSVLADQEPLPRPALRFQRLGIDERDLFLVAFGDLLFASPQILGEPARSLGLACATCHNRGDINQRFFIPGLSSHPGTVDVDSGFFNPRANDRRDDPLDIASLRGIRFTGPYGRDGRFASLRDLIRDVIVNQFGGPEPSPLVLDALVAYLLELDFLPTPYLDFAGRLTDLAPPAAKRGEALFRRPFAQMGDRSCASCHLPDSYFTDHRVHTIGSGGPAGDAFDTPTLLNASYTAPYFHDGSLATLGDVVAWFDNRFGLGLSDGQRADLTAYLEVVGTGEQPYQNFDQASTPLRPTSDELAVFLSTLDTLIPARDQVAADLVLRTVAADLTADAGAMTNRTGLAKAHELADRLWQLRDAIAGGNWELAQSLWRDYRGREQEYWSELP